MKLLTKKLTRAEALQYVARKIVARPEEYEQRSFCGTAYCIAGHLDILESGKHVLSNANPRSRNIGRRAFKMIGNEAETGLNLFGPYLYGRFRSQWENADYDKPIKRARIGARAIKHYISKQDPKVMGKKVVCKGYDPAFGEPRVAK